ncbi:MAG: hypothetical protein MJA83_14925, partial [Gammaproteobacteria bacterium]|nr:hypothetical protein [Gammaproteobacteria bacterium]
MKYLYKYILKGSDRVMFTVREGQADEHQVHDEVETFLNARYISASEACWRIFKFALHSREPSVEKLHCHLPDDQQVIFEEGAARASIAQGPPQTKLTAYFQLNREDETARRILYPDIPRYFTWNASQKKWQPRKRGLLDENHMFMGTALGRIP